MEIKHIACTWYDEQGFKRDLDVTRYAEVILHDGKIYIADNHRIVAGELVAAHGFEPTPLAPNVDGVWSDHGGNDGFIPDTGELERVGLA